MFLRDHYPFLCSVLLNWCKEEGKQPLLIFPLGQGEWEVIKEEFTAYLLGIEDGVLPKDKLNCADVVVLQKEKDKKNISIARTREFIRELNLSSSVLPFKLGFIPMAETLNSSSQNALLKTMEEPQKNKFLFLFSSSRAQILPTLLSRSIVFSLKKNSKELIKNYLVESFPEFSPEKNEKIEAWSRGRVHMAHKIAKDYASFERFFDIYTNLKKYNSEKKLEIAEEIMKEKGVDLTNLFELFAFLDDLELKKSLIRKDYAESEKLVGRIKRSLECLAQMKKTNSATPGLILEAFLLNS